MKKPHVLSIALFAMTLFFLNAQNAQGSITYGTLGSTSSENFNTLAQSGNTNTWTDDTTIDGWYSNRTVYLANIGNNSTGGLHSFGPANNVDRALGSVASGTTGSVLYALVLQNTTGSTLNSFTVTYDGEQWRQGGNTNQQSLTFDYLLGGAVPAIGAAGGTSVAALNFNGPQFTGATTSIDGNAGGNRVAGITSTITGVNWTPGQFLMLRWTDANDTGNDHGLGIDNFSFSAVPEPSSALLFGGLVGLLGITRRRR